MKRIIAALLVLMPFSMMTPAAYANIHDCTIGEVRLFAGNFAPKNWVKAEGQLLQISQHSALFSVLGITYGGDGRTNFALPDLKGPANKDAPENKPDRYRTVYIICVVGSYPMRS
ncbi:MAG: tail fiber protein [Kordiimonadaceae bacterium]|nr:tail fiber protein [Kordiimonadaceae bacterium]